MTSPRPIWSQNCGHCVDLLMTFGHVQLLSLPLLLQYHTVATTHSTPPMACMRHQQEMGRMDQLPRVSCPIPRGLISHILTTPPLLGLTWHPARHNTQTQALKCLMTGVLLVLAPQAWLGPHQCPMTSDPTNSQTAQTLEGGEG